MKPIRWKFVEISKNFQWIFNELVENSLKFQRIFNEFSTNFQRQDWNFNCMLSNFQWGDFEFSMVLLCFSMVFDDQPLNFQQMFVEISTARRWIFNSPPLKFQRPPPWIFNGIVEISSETKNLIIFLNFATKIKKKALRFT